MTMMSSTPKRCLRAAQAKNGQVALADGLSYRYLIISEGAADSIDAGGGPETEGVGGGRDHPRRRAAKEMRSV